MAKKIPTGNPLARATYKIEADYLKIETFPDQRVFAFCTSLRSYNKHILKIMKGNIESPCIS
jgi:hypothetical protein